MVKLADGKFYHYYCACKGDSPRSALGLAVAIPAVLGYNALVRGNKSILGSLNSFAHDLHAYFVTGARVNAGGEQGKVLPMKKGG